MHTDKFVGFWLTGFHSEIFEHVLPTEFFGLFYEQSKIRSSLPQNQTSLSLKTENLVSGKMV